MLSPQYSYLQKQMCDIRFISRPALLSCQNITLRPASLDCCTVGFENIRPGSLWNQASYPVLTFKACPNVIIEYVMITQYCYI